MHQNIVGIIGHEDAHPLHWGLTSSRSLRPRLECNINSDKGWLALLSAFNGYGPVRGRISVLLDSLPHVMLVAIGVGGDQTGFRYTDALVQVDGEAQFYLERTAAPDVVLTFFEDTVTELQLVTPPDNAEDFIPLTSEGVTRWRANPVEP